MLLFLDTAFFRRPFCDELISIGVVAEPPGGEIYAQVAGVDLTDAEPWLRENVVAQLDDQSWTTCEAVAAAIQNLIAGESEVQVCT